MHGIGKLRRGLHHWLWHHVCGHSGLHWCVGLHGALIRRLACGLLVLSLFEFVLLSEDSALTGLNCFVHAFARSAHLLPILARSVRIVIVARVFVFPAVMVGVTTVGVTVLPTFVSLVGIFRTITSVVVVVVVIVCFLPL